MEIHPPLCVTSRLLPGARIGGAEISIDYAYIVNNRQHFQWNIDLNGQYFSGSDLRSGVGGDMLQEGLETLLSFLGAFAKRIAYEERTGEKCEGPDLFPLGLAEWAAENADEISILGCLLVDKQLIVEGPVAQWVRAGHS